MTILKNNFNKIAKILFPLLAVIVVILIWGIYANIIGAEVIMPTPLNVLKNFFNTFTEKAFYTSVFTSLLRALKGFLISYVLAFILAYLSYKCAYVRYFCYPFVVISRGIPTMSIVLICYLLTSPETSPIIISTIVLFPISYSQLLENFNSLDSGVLMASKVYGVSEKKVLFSYVLPEVLSLAFLSAINLLAFSVKLTISAEAVIQTEYSFGVLMTQAKVSLQTGKLFSYTIVAILLGLVFEIIAVAVKKLIDKRKGAL